MPAQLRLDQHPLLSTGQHWTKKNPESITCLRGFNFYRILLDYEMVEDMEPYPNSFSEPQDIYKAILFNTLPHTKPFSLPDSERNLILYIFPKQRTDVGSIPD